MRGLVGERKNVIWSLVHTSACWTVSAHAPTCVWVLHQGNAVDARRQSWVMLSGWAVGTPGSMRRLGSTPEGSSNVDKASRRRPNRPQASPSTHTAKVVMAKIIHLKSGCTYQAHQCRLIFWLSLKELSERINEGQRVQCQILMKINR